MAMALWTLKASKDGANYYSSVAAGQPLSCRQLRRTHADAGANVGVSQEQELAGERVAVEVEIEAGGLKP
jgi:hypothetical protein